MPEKVYVIDTNVLMYAGKKALTSFQDNEVIVPFAVIEELEKKRMEDGLPGTMARHALREIDSLRSSGKLKHGVEINSAGGTFRIEMNHRDKTSLPSVLLQDCSTDIRILAVAHNLYQEEIQKGEGSAREVILVTNDLPLRIKADSLLDMRIEPFRLVGNEYPGFSTVDVNQELIDELYTARREGREIPIPAELKKIMGRAKNYAFNLRSWNSKSTLAMASQETLRLADMNLKVLKSVTGKSLEQKAAMDYLLNPDMEILSLGGPAGTGKSLISLVAGIQQMEGIRPEYRKTVIIRPMYSVGGQDIGFLPGDADDKMEPWRKAIYDSVEGIVDPKTIERMSKDGLIDVIPATFLRGRTFHDTYVIVDEAQNFEASVLLTILSRIGQGSKIVFLWDAAQRDNGRLGYGDGIISVIDKLKSHEMFAHVSLVKSERSRVAEIAGDILEDYLG